MVGFGSVVLCNVTGLGCVFKSVTIGFGGIVILCVYFICVVLVVICCVVVHCARMFVCLVCVPRGMVMW